MNLPTTKIKIEDIILIYNWVYKEFKPNLASLPNTTYYDITYLSIVTKSENSIFFTMSILPTDPRDNGPYFFDCSVKEIWIELEQWMKHVLILKWILIFSFKKIK